MNKKGLSFNKQTAPKIASIGRSEGGSGEEQAQHRQAVEAMSEEKHLFYGSQKLGVFFLVWFGGTEIFFGGQGKESQFYKTDTVYMYFSSPTQRL